MGPYECPSAHWKNEMKNLLVLPRGEYEEQGWRVRKGGSLAAFGKATRNLFETPANAEAHHRSEELLQLLLDSAHDCAIHVLDPAGCIVSWSKGAELLTGYHAEEVIAKHYGLLFRREDQAEGFPNWQLQRARVHGRMEEDGWLLRKDGSTCPAHFVLAPLHSSDGSPVGFARMARDTGDTSRLHELAQSLQRASEFLAVLGHELRAPLAPMRYAVSVLQMHGNKNTSSRSACQVLDRQVSLLGRMLEDLLEAGRLTSGRSAIRAEPIPFGRVVVHALDAAWPLINERSQTIEMDVAEQLWVKGDEVGLIQVLRNLLSNAAKFTHEGGALRVSAGVVDERLCVQVSDNGQGMDPETIDAMFELFAQGKKAACTRDQGLGIGLAVARAIVEGHGGTITAISAGPGKGSVFSVELPNASVRSDNVHAADIACPAQMRSMRFGQGQADAPCHGIPVDNR